MKHALGILGVTLMLGAGGALAQGTPTGPSGQSIGQGTGGGPSARECAQARSDRFSTEELQVQCRERGYWVPEYLTPEIE